jgi:hypothetical protein
MMALKSAAVVPGALAGLLSVNDQVTLSAIAEYDTAAVGTGKTITVKHSISGADAVNYLAPQDEQLQTGVITPAPLKITAEAKEINCGETLPIFTFVYDGLVGDDQFIEVEPQISSDAVNGSGAGTYAISLSGGESSNYTLELINGSLRILELDVEEITVSACETYTWDKTGLSYEESGTFEYQDGCQKYVLLLTLTQPELTEVEACGSYEWNGEVYTESGTYDFTPEGASCVTERLVLSISEELTLVLSKVNPTPAQAGTSVPVTLEVKDACGNLISDLLLADVTFNFGVDTTARIENFTFEGGLYKFDVYSERAGVLLLSTSTDRGPGNAGLELEFLGAVIDIEKSILQAKDQSKLVANGKVALPVTIQALDRFGNVVPGVTITLVQPASGKTIIKVNETNVQSNSMMASTTTSSVSGTTDEEGVVGFTISSTVAQKVKYTVFAEIDGVLVELGSFELEFLAGLIDVNESSLEAEPSIQVIEQSSVLKVSLKDENGNPIIGLVEEDFDISLGASNAELVQESFKEIWAENEEGIEVPTGEYNWEILDSEPEKVTVNVKVRQVEFGEDVDTGEEPVEEDENEVAPAEEEEWLQK